MERGTNTGYVNQHVIVPSYRLIANIGQFLLPLIVTTGFCSVQDGYLPFAPSPWVPAGVLALLIAIFWGHDVGQMLQTACEWCRKLPGLFARRAADAKSKKSTDTISKDDPEGLPVPVPLTRLGTGT